MNELVDVSEELALGSAGPSRQARDMEVLLYCPECSFMGMPLGTMYAPNSNTTPSGVVTIINSTIVCYMESAEAKTAFPVLVTSLGLLVLLVLCAFGGLLLMLWHRVRRRSDKSHVEAPVEGGVNPPPVVVGIPLPYAVGKPPVANGRRLDLESGA